MRIPVCGEMPLSIPLPSVQDASLLEDGNGQWWRVGKSVRVAEATLLTLFD